MNPLRSAIAALNSFALILARTAVRSGASLVVGVSTAWATSGNPASVPPAIRRTRPKAEVFRCAHDHLLEACFFLPPERRYYSSALSGPPYAFVGVNAYPLPSLANDPAPGNGKWAPQIIILSAITRSSSLRRDSTARGPS